MKIVNVQTLLLIGITVSGCGGSSSSVDHPEDYVPELRYFDVIDSYDVDTARTPHAQLTLDPYRHDGLFEFYWQVDSLEDYTVTLKINDRPSLTNSMAVHSEVCGLNKWCDQSGGVICEYTEDFYLSCDNSLHPTDIATLFTDKPPQTLYLLLEVCDYDSFYCEYDYYPVSML